jgi:branched-chain amino acid transport system ATP-binding protein
MSLLAVRGLAKAFGGLVAVRALSFDVEPGEIVGMIGPNGAGKTTTFALLTGFLQPSAGSVTFHGKPVNGLRPDQTCALGMTRTFQIAQPFAGLTVLENVMVGSFLHQQRTLDARRQALAVLERVHLEHQAEVQARILTIAERKRLELARALATRPRLLLLDETMSGLRPAEVDAAIALIRSLCEDGITFIIIEHVMHVIMSLSDRVMVLHHGEKIADGAPAVVAADPAVLDAYLGEEVAIV